MICPEVPHLSSPSCIVQIRSVVKQVEVALGDNRRTAQPAAMIVAGFSGRVAEVAGGMSASGWKARKIEASVRESFPADEVKLEG